MGCVQSYFKRAHTAGLSPSSTQDSTSKAAAVEEDAKPIIAEEKSLAEEPESNDTSYGVEATAVRTLAASTGTVAILGTTAKTNGKSEEDDGKCAVSVQEEEKLENTTISLEKAEVHEPNTREQSNVEISQNHEHSKIIVDNDKLLTTQLPSSVNVRNVDAEITTKDDQTDASEEIKDATAKVVVSNDVEILQERPKSVLENVQKNNEDVNPIEINQELLVEEDNSKSISSERFKTNSISDTTLSESYNAELETTSVKQSPSVEKVLESFDSSSTVEFVDVVNKEIKNKDDGMSTSVNQDKENALTPTDVASVETEVFSPVEGERSLADHTELDESVAKVQDNQHCENVLLNEKPNKLDDVQEILTANDGTSMITPVTAVFVSPIKSTVEDKGLTTPLVPNDSKLQENNSQYVSDNKKEEDNDTLASAATVIQATFRGYQTRQNLKEDHNNESSTPGPISFEGQQPKIDSIEDTLVNSEANKGLILDEDSAATTIQAAFRGFQTRQALNTEEPKTKPETKENPINLDNDLNNAATKIQATFRGFQARHHLKTDEVENLIGKTEAVVDTASEELHNAATTIQANFRGFKVRQNLKNEEIEGESDDKESSFSANSVKEKGENFDVNNQLIGHNITQNTLEDLVNEEEKDYKLVSAATTIQATFRGFQTRQNLISAVPAKSQSDGAFENINKQPNSLEENKLDSQELVNSAATTIQAAFRGFQTRQDLKHDQQDLEVEETLATLDEVIKAESADYNITETADDNITENRVQIEDKNDELNRAATKIQASFRGFHTRQNIKNTSLVNGEEEVDATRERRTMTPEDIESVKEEVDEICKQAVATTESILAAGNKDFVINNNFKTQQSTEQKDVKETPTISEQTMDFLEDEKLASAATTIQASFRGYQARQNLQKMVDTEDQPDVSKFLNATELM